MKTSDKFVLIGVGSLYAIVMAWFFGATLIERAETVQWNRAKHCSRILHKYADGTLTPLTDDASQEIGACILIFNQPLNGESNE